jgi:hypothetical protein
MTWFSVLFDYDERWLYFATVQRWARNDNGVGFDTERFVRELCTLPRSRRAP